MADAAPASWEDDEPSALPPPAAVAEQHDEEEEAFVAPTVPAPAPEVDEDRQTPVLLVNLTALADDLATEGFAMDFARMREAVLSKLRANYAAASAQLFAAGMCQHSEKWKCEADREAA